MSDSLKAVLFILVTMNLTMTQLWAQESVDSKVLEVKAMSFNIRPSYARDKENRWDLSKELVYQVIKDYSPDVLGL